MAVTPAIIATALGQTAPESGSPTEAQWQMWIDDALRHIERRAERLSIDFATLNAEDVDYVVREAVLAHLDNPSRAAQVDISVDDSRVSRRYTSSSGRVEILDDWWTLLGLIGSSGRAFEIDTMPDPTVLR